MQLVPILSEARKAPSDFRSKVLDSTYLTLSQIKIICKALDLPKNKSKQELVDLILKRLKSHDVSIEQIAKKRNKTRKNMISLAREDVVTFKRFAIESKTAKSRFIDLDDLKDICVELGLDVSGSKSVIIQRIVDCMSDVELDSIPREAELDKDGPIEQKIPASPIRAIDYKAKLGSLLFKKMSSVKHKIKRMESTVHVPEGITWRRLTLNEEKLIIPNNYVTRLDHFNSAELVNRGSYNSVYNCTVANGRSYSMRISTAPIHIGHDDAQRAVTELYMTIIMSELGISPKVYDAFSAVVDMRPLGSFVKYVIVSDYADGGDLCDFLEKKAKLVRHAANRAAYGCVTREDLAELARQTIYHYHQMAEHGLLCVDVKAQNMLVFSTPTGYDVKIIDFGTDFCHKTKKLERFKDALLKYALLQVACHAKRRCMNISEVTNIYAENVSRDIKLTDLPLIRNAMRALASLETLDRTPTYMLMYYFCGDDCRIDNMLFDGNTETILSLAYMYAKLDIGVMHEKLSAFLVKKHESQGAKIYVTPSNLQNCGFRKNQRTVVFEPPNLPHGFRLSLSDLATIMGETETNFEDIIRKTISENDVVVYYKQGCPFCKSTKKSLKNLKITAKLIDLDTVENGYEIAAALVSMTKQDTVPNIFVKGRHLGGNNELKGAISSGELQKMLA